MSGAERILNVQHWETCADSSLDGAEIGCTHFISKLVKGHARSAFVKKSISWLFTLMKFRGDDEGVNLIESWSQAERGGSGVT